MKKFILSLMTLSFVFTAQSQSWSLTGNNGTNPAVHFVGTRDNKPLKFRINNQYAGEIDSVLSKTFFGYGAGKSTTTGGGNTAIGYQSLHSNTTSGANTAIGYQSLYSSKTGGNTAIGYQSLRSNTTGEFSTAIGFLALVSNTTGSYNSALGTFALDYNSTGSGNTAIGIKALYHNTIGNSNSATGRDALLNNTSGSYNTANGDNAQAANQSGNYNTGLGSYALFGTTNSQFNTVVGYNSGSNYDMGYNNTILGANCDGSFDGQFNIIAIGQDVTCPDNSTARIGNLATWSIGGYANWTNFSDGRYKKNVQENVKGLEFIMKLRPVTYHLDASGISKKSNGNVVKERDEKMKEAITEKGKAVFSGFVAQEVEQAATETGYDFSGVDKPRNEHSFYGLRYAEFVVPLVKAMQEQQQIINELRNQNADLQKRLTSLENKSGINYPSSYNATDALSIWPNPSHDMVSINIVTNRESQAMIKIFDNKGALIKTQAATVLQGSNQLSINMKGMPGGIYQLSAEWNNGQIKKTVQIIKQ